MSNPPTSKLFYSGLFILFQIIFSLQSFSQVQVDPFTGRASVSIPLTTVNSKEISYPISAHYSTGGMKVDAATGNLGTGWFLSIQGSISREVNDLPDDYYGDGTVKKLGWLHEGTAELVQQYVPDGNLDTCQFDTLEYQYLKRFGGYLGNDTIRDIQPDIFYINVPGHLSASFIFGTNNSIIQLGGEDLIIEVIEQETNGIIEQFRVTNAAGVVYQFESMVMEDSDRTPATTSAAVDYFKREYFLGDLEDYCISWGLSSIVTPSGDRMDFTYSFFTRLYANSTFGATRSTSVKDVNAYVYSPASDEFEVQPQYEIEKTYALFQKSLLKIESNDQSLLIQSGGLVPPYGDYDFIDTQIDRLIKYDADGNEIDNVDFEYSMIQNSNAVGSHIYLRSISRVSENVRSLISGFNYYGVEDEANSARLIGSDTTFYYASIHSNRATSNKDLYGYFNNVDEEASDLTVKTPSMYIYPESGFEYHLDPDDSIAPYQVNGIVQATPNILMLSVGSLKTIYFPNGGKQSIFYEPNDYYDAFTQSNQYGGGIRVNKLVTHDGVDFANDQETTYVYATNGVSNGVLLWRPRYWKRNHFFENPDDSTKTYFDELDTLYTGIDLFKRTYVLSDFDQSGNNGPSVGYRVFEEIKNGIGKTQYTFDEPIGWNSNSRDFWKPSQWYIGRDEVQFADFDLDYCQEMGLEESPENPFQKNMYASLYNGRLSTQSVFDNSGLKVSKTSYEYENHTSIDSIYLFDEIISTWSPIYGTYEDPFNPPAEIDGTTLAPSVLATGGYLRTNQKRQVKNVESVRYEGTDSVTTSQNYTYTSKYQVKTVTQKLEGAEIGRTTNIYPYEISLGSYSGLDDAGKAVFKMNALKQWMPVESITTIKDGSNDRLVSASINIPKYKATANQLLPWKQYSLEKEKLVSAYDSLSFSGDTLTIDADMKLVSEVISYTDEGYSTSVIAGGVAKSGQHFTEFGLPSLTISNALAEEVSYTDFDSRDDHALSYSTSNLINGRVVGNGYSLATWANSLIDTLATDGYDSYIISAWAKGSNSGILKVKINGSEVNVFNFSNSSDWVYYEGEVDIPAGSTTIFELYVSANVDLDEIAIYPEGSSVSYAHYNSKREVVCQTNSMGISTYYEYDGIGRLAVVRDKDQHITKAYSYQNYGDLPNTNLSISTAFPIQQIVNTNISAVGDDTFTSYKWQIVRQEEYDPDTFSITTTGQNIIHSFDSLGDHVIRLRAYQGANVYFEVVDYVKVVLPPLVIDLEFNKPHHLDLCSEEAGSLTVVASVSQGSGNYQYEWFKGSSEVGTDSNTLTTTNYMEQDIYCKVRDLNTDRVDFSIKLRFTSFYSESGCQTE